ncbi:MAG TPA: hypothetical protein P5513_07795 [Candidatus Diapherotrites archaeon]|mgnify:CR=1 FL=1|nr:hypothetical protein [Candidatus Diapherotrites archaeon]
MEEIRFSKEVNFIGRNGYFKCIGLKMYNTLGVITLQPITSKNYGANCEVQIPIEDRDEFIKKLQTL